MGSCSRPAISEAWGRRPSSWWRGLFLGFIGVKVNRVQEVGSWAQGYVGFLASRNMPMI